MTNSDLLNKRVLPALEQMYKESDNIFQEKHTNWPNEPSISWNEINNVIKEIKNEGKDFDAHFILDCFYLDKEKQDKILKKATSNLRHYWRWPYRSEIYEKGEEFEDLLKERDNIIDKLENLSLDKKEKDQYSEALKEVNERIKWCKTCEERDNLWNEYYKKLTQLSKQLENKEITRKEYNKLEEKLAKEYNCTRRSRDAEAVYFEIWNYSPTTSEEAFKKYQQWWSELMCIKTIKTESNIEKLVEELYFKKNHIQNNMMDGKQFDEMKKIQEYMKNAWIFIEKYCKMYNAQCAS